MDGLRHGWKYESQRAAIDWFLAKAWDCSKIKGGLVGFLSGVVEWILRGFKYHRKLIRWISRDLWTI